MTETFKFKFTPASKEPIASIILAKIALDKDGNIVNIEYMGHYSNKVSFKGKKYFF